MQHIDAHIDQIGHQFGKVAVGVTTGAAVFWAIIFMMGIIIAQEIISARLQRQPLMPALQHGCIVIIEGLIKGAQNMISVALALAAAGIIVGVVAATGLSNALSTVVETLAGGNIYLLLALVAVLSIILGMGLPTTANYLVVATLMVPVVVEVGSNAGLVLPLIAVHLYVFYFGLMADVTPPVALAAYAAAGISKGDPFKTGVQAFVYSIRTAILPLIFVFNLDLLLIDVTSVPEAIMIFIISLIAILCFTSISFRWMLAPLSWLEIGLLAFACVGLFLPDIIMERFVPAYQATAPSTLERGLQVSSARMTFVSGEENGEQGNKKIITITLPDGQDKMSFKTLGVTVEPLDNGDYQISDPGFMSPASKAGVDFDDVISLVEIKNLTRLSPRWIYIPALLAFLLVFASQRKKSKISRIKEETLT